MMPLWGWCFFGDGISGNDASLTMMPLWRWCLFGVDASLVMMPLWWWCLFGNDDLWRWCLFGNAGDVNDMDMKCPKITFPLFFHPSISQLYLWIPPKLYDRGSCIITQRGTFILYICGHVLAYCWIEGKRANNILLLDCKWCIFWPSPALEGFNV